MTNEMGMVSDVSGEDDMFRVRHIVPMACYCQSQCRSLRTLLMSTHTSHTTVSSSVVDLQQKTYSIRLVFPTRKQRGGNYPVQPALLHIVSQSAYIRYIHAGLIRRTGRGQLARFSESQAPKSTPSALPGRVHQKWTPRWQITSVRGSKAASG